MNYWCTRRSSVGALVGVIGLVIVTNLLSGCVGSGSTTSEVGLVADETISVPNSALGGSDTTLAAPTVSTLTSPASSTANPGGGGPQTPSCGIFEVTKAEVVSGQQFSKGKYHINTFGISCDEVMGDAGLFSQFLNLEDNGALPEPWRFLEGAVGAPKFVSGPAVGFRVQRISD